MNINSVCITGNLCMDPELRSFPSGGSVARLRVAVNGGYKSRETNEWVDKAHFFDVEVFNRQAESSVEHLSKGRAIAVQGRLDYQEWETDDGKRSKVVIRANTLQFLGGPNGNGQARERDDAPAPAAATNQATGGELTPTGPSADDDIPF